MQREQYWISRRGLRFGVPHGAHQAALARMMQMKPRSHGNAIASRAGANAAAAATWKFIGPQPMLNDLPNFGGPITGPALPDATGRVTAIAIDPTVLGRFFVGTANGGLWMSTDGGRNFTSISDNFPGFQGSTEAIGSIVLDTLNSNPPTIYVGTGEGNSSADSYYGRGIFKSTNLGSSWTKLAPGVAGAPDQFELSSVQKLAIKNQDNSSPVQPPLILNPPILLAAVKNGASTSRADATTFPSDPNSAGYWLSTNGGNSWQRQNLCEGYAPLCTVCTQPDRPDSRCEVSDVVVDPFNTDNVYVAVDGDDVYHTSQVGPFDAPVVFGAAHFPDGAGGLFPTAQGQLGRATIAIGPTEGIGNGNCQPFYFGPAPYAAQCM